VITGIEDIKPKPVRKRYGIGIEEGMTKKTAVKKKVVELRWSM